MPESGGLLARGAPADKEKEGLVRNPKLHYNQTG
jgi:hypothetical protein